MQNVCEFVHFAYSGNVDQVTSLLDGHADPDATDILGRTALIHAAAQGHSKIVNLLLKASASVNFSPTLDGRTALHWAAHHNHIESCRFLQLHGADALLKDNDGNSGEELAMYAPADFMIVPDKEPILFCKLTDMKDDLSAEYLSSQFSDWFIEQEHANSEAHQSTEMNKIEIENT